MPSQSNLIKITVISVLVFIASCYWVGNVNQRAEILKYEIEEKLSVGSAVRMTIKSFFDGITFGKFEEEGPFSELKKFERWEQSMNDQISRLQNEYSASHFLRITFLLISIGGGIGIYITRSRTNLSE